MNIRNSLRMMTMGWTRRSVALLGLAVAAGVCFASADISVAQAQAKLHGKLHKPYQPYKGGFGQPAPRYKRAAEAHHAAQ